MKVYFNNSCKICKAEIDLYKKEKIQDINWVDISNNRDAEIETNKNVKQLLRRLHVKKNGKVYVGAEAFLIVWKKMMLKIRIFKESEINCLIYNLPLK